MLSLISQEVRTGDNKEKQKQVSIDVFEESSEDDLIDN
jgi:hypothetical protein